jgi:hypothetical protein
VCGLCGDLTPEQHWSDLGAAERGPRDRLARLRAIRQLMSGTGLTVTEWRGRGYQLSNGRGRTVLVRDLGALWEHAAQLRGGRPVDPLSPDAPR